MSKVLEDGQLLLFEDWPENFIDDIPEKKEEDEFDKEQEECDDFSNENYNAELADLLSPMYVGDNKFYIPYIDSYVSVDMLSELVKAIGTGKGPCDYCDRYQEPPSCTLDEFIERKFGVRVVLYQTNITEASNEENDIPF